MKGSSRRHFTHAILQTEWHGEESPGEPEIVRLLGK